MFNLNASRKPEYDLNESLISEVIGTFGIKCKYLFSEKVNKDYIFKDFSHLKVGKDYKDIYSMPENTENWDGDTNFDLFGFHNMWTQNLYISKSQVFELFPDFKETGRHKLLNSLVITPSGTLLEITNVESYNVGMNNLWGFADEPSSYRLTVKIYDNNQPDEGTDINTNVNLEEEEIFEYNEDVATGIDQFFETLSTKKEKIDDLSKTKNDTDNPFGTLS